ncbi:hypothetical protein [Methylobacillus glycogenes]|nr:hypothetical protein [Methylobacillus glycogenes]
MVTKNCPFFNLACCDIFESLTGIIHQQQVDAFTLKLVIVV